MKYAHLEETTNKILGWYDDEIHTKKTTFESNNSILTDIDNVSDGKLIEDFKKTDEFLSYENIIDISIDRNSKNIVVIYCVIEPDIPTPNIEVSDEDWQSAINISANHIDVNTKKFSVKDFRTPEEIKKHEKAQAKIQKEEELKSLTIDINTVLYDANQEALGNFATVIAIANATFNKAITVGVNVDGTTKVLSGLDAYNFVYKQTVSWKGADNKWHTVQIESIVQTAQDAMTKKAEILAKY